LRNFSIFSSRNNATPGKHKAIITEKKTASPNLLLVGKKAIMLTNVITDEMAYATTELDIFPDSFNSLLYNRVMAEKLKTINVATKIAILLSV
jgi:hypothetical protein